jgi:hypothetical protein
MASDFPRYMPGQQVRVFMGSGWRTGKVIRPPDAKHRMVAVMLPDRTSPVVVYDPRNITNG